MTVTVADPAPLLAPEPSAPHDKSEPTLAATTDFEVPPLRRNSSINVPVAWDQAEIVPGEQQNGHLTPDQAAKSGPGSEGGGSRGGRTSGPSTIHDRGEGDLLKAEEEEESQQSGPTSHKRSPSESRRSTAELVAQSDPFQGTEGPSRPQTSLTVDESQTNPPNLERAIRAAFRVSASRDKGEYLPIDAFKQIVTRDRVHQELTRLVPHIIPAEKLDWYADQVWHVTPPTNSRESRSHEPRPTTRRKIFAILALIEKVQDIVHFINDKIHDNDLPFLLSDGENPGTRQLQRKGRDGTLYPITIVSSWPAFMLEVFNDYQWKLLPPYFTLSTNKKPEVLHYSFEDGIVLPLIEDEAIASGGRGGYGDVWRVKIHPAHHNCSGASDHDNPPYAIKRLRHNNREAFRDEVSNLKRFSTRDHLHLIKLLVTFEWRKEFYLLFPCADGNLLDFWKLYPTIDGLPRNHGLALWFSSQCLGLAEGLKMIHTVEIKQGEYLGIPQHEQEKTHGRHGDLKPENILWFRPVGAYRPDEADEGNMGVLKISDFGLTKFHRTGSMLSGQNKDKGTPVSPTYRAPEYDIDQGFDQSYDIWTLGCVLLEFVAWYLLGWDEVERFSRKRVEDDYREIKEDVFFNNVDIVYDDRGKKEVETGAQAKRAVYNEFQILYEHERCSDFILDLLDFIKDKLLRMGPGKRAKCEEIVQKLTKLHETCEKDTRYCIGQRTSDCPRPRADLSLLTASALPYSDRQKKRIHRNMVPEVRLQDNFPSVDAKLAAASQSRPPSRTERLVEGINHFITDLGESYRKGEHHVTVEQSKTPDTTTSAPITIAVPSFTITVSPPPPSIPVNETGRDSGIPSAQGGAAQPDTPGVTTEPVNENTGEGVQSGETTPRQQTASQPATQLSLEGDTTDQDVPKQIAEHVSSETEKHRMDGNGHVPGNPGPPRDPSRQRSLKQKSKTSRMGCLICRFFPPKRETTPGAAS